MTDTTISDAVAWPQDDGTGVSDGSEDYNSAAYFSLISRYKGDGTYVGEDVTGSATLQFNDVDTTNEQVDVGSGHAYINESGKSVQEGSQTGYNTTLPVDVPYVVILPSEVVDLPLDTDTTNDVWLAVDPANQDDVFIRSGSGLNAPSVPNVKLGTVDSSDGSTTRANDFANPTVEDLTAGTITDKSSNTTYDVDNLSGGLLGDAGYSSDKIFPIATFTTVRDRNVSTSSSSFTEAISQIETVEQWNTLLDGTSATTYVRCTAELDGGTDTCYYRVYNTTDSEAVTNTISSSASPGRVVSAWSSYTPTTTGSPIRISQQIRNDDGSTTVTARYPIFQVGIQL